MLDDMLTNGYIFLPTCPARGTTSPTTRPSQRMDVFLPTCPARGTTFLRGIIVSVFIFLPTCPARGTTRIRAITQEENDISTHVPREGHDRAGAPGGADDIHISTHVPREGHDQRRVTSSVQP